MNKKKQIFDYVHGLMPIDSFYFKFIDTPHFQRLRELYQLTTSQFVFPCANHRRFEHSLGTFFLTLSRSPLFVITLGILPILNPLKCFVKRKIFLLIIMKWLLSCSIIYSTPIQLIQMQTKVKALMSTCFTDCS